MNYTEKELGENYNKFIDLIKSQFTGDRLDKLINLYGDSEYGYQVSISPASPKDYTNNAYIGGYIDHVMTLHKASLGVKKLWEIMGGIIDFTSEELAFSVINNGLGILGDKDVGEYYLPNDSEWHVKNTGALYKTNADLQHMLISDRSLFTLQKYGIVCTWKEYLAIKLSNGLYNEGNKSYLYTFTKDMDLKTNLPNVVHEAYMMAYQSEIDIEKQKTL